MNLSMTDAEKKMIHRIGIVSILGEDLVVSSCDLFGRISSCTNLRALSFENLRVVDWKIDDYIEDLISSEIKRCGSYEPVRITENVTKLLRYYRDDNIRDEYPYETRFAVEEAGKCLEELGKANSVDSILLVVRSISASVVFHKYLYI